MKRTFSIILKIGLILMFLYYTPFIDGLNHIIGCKKDILHNFIYHPKIVSNDINLKEQLNVLTYNKNLTIPQQEIEIETTYEKPMIVPNTIQKEEDLKKDIKSNGKRIYIYNTHQGEKYSDGKSVMDAAVILGKKLEEKGYKVVLETNDFEKYLNTHGLNYDDLYLVSNKYLNEALVNYGGFDLCIDLHRDSVPREYSYITIDGKSYAKSMMVIGGSSKNVNSATKISSILTDKINHNKNGIMKSVMTRDIAYYNQQVCEGVILMECGSDHNNFDEVKNTLEYISIGIDELLKEGW